MQIVFPFACLWFKMMRKIVQLHQEGSDLLDTVKISFFLKGNHASGNR